MANGRSDDRSITAKLRRRTDNSHFSSAVIALINRDANVSCLIRQFSRNGMRDCRLKFMHRAREARKHNKITLPPGQPLARNNLLSYREWKIFPRELYLGLNYFSRLMQARARASIRDLLPSLGRRAALT